DAVVANSASGDVSMLLGNGRGSFRSTGRFAAGTQPLRIVNGDFNGDGKLDVVVVNNGAPSMSLLLGNGLGAFGARISVPVGTPVDRLVADDFNGDGHTDLAATLVDSQQLGILLASGNGFGDMQPVALDGSPSAVVSADVDGNGAKDVVAAVNS